MIETPRLLLRRWRADDVAALTALSAEAAVIEFLPGAMSTAQVEAFIEAQNALCERHQTCYFAAELKETGELAGFVGLKYQDFDRPFAPCYELGWRLASRHWGKGYASEGALAAMRHGFEVLGLDEIVSFTVPENLRSRSVMERLGMHRDLDADFAHPALPVDHRLSRHVLYRIRKNEAA
jgi:RimJ/RimL family protein N-acetyltransferase